MQKIRCVVERITYQNPENGYSVLKCRVKDYSELVPVIGNMIDANVGSVLVCEGNWKVDSKYGRQFVAENWEETLPATVYGMEKYLGSGLIKGVGPKFAKKIVQKYGSDTFAVIEDNVELLIEIEGIGKKRVQMIAESWERQKEVKNIMLFLQDHQVSTSYAAKIYKQYGNDSIAVMKENPYKLADDIWGIGFKTADQIAAKLGFGKESYVRLRSGLMYTLSELSNEGHVYAEKQQLIDTASALLEASEETVTMTMDDMIAKEELIREKNIVKIDDEVFNGDIGLIESVNETDRTLTVNFDGRSIEYDVTELDELVHAYATTIHKAQGSEYPIVVMPILMNHYVMLQRNLIYTGITRAKKVLVMVGTKKALSYAVRNVTVTKRNTLLKERLE